jgi:hypothetical protein
VSSFFTQIITVCFGGAREKLNAIEEDKKKNCFICGKSNEGTSQSFKTHIETFHNVWYYFLYIDYLQKMYKSSEESMSFEELRIYYLTMHPEKE